MGMQVLLVAAENSIGSGRPEPGGVTAVLVDQPSTLYDGSVMSNAYGGARAHTYTHTLTDARLGAAHLGLVRAYTSLSGRLVQTVGNVVFEPMQVYRESVRPPFCPPRVSKRRTHPCLHRCVARLQGTSSAVVAAVRSLPGAVLHPARGMVEAVSALLLGARNSLDHSSRIDASERARAAHPDDA